MDFFKTKTASELKALHVSEQKRKDQERVNRAVQPIYNEVIRAATAGKCEIKFPLFHKFDVSPAAYAEYESHVQDVATKVKTIFPDCHVQVIATTDTEHFDKNPSMLTISW